MARKRKSGPVDVRAKRPGETHLQWRARLAHLESNERDREQPLVSKETARHGRYIEEYLMHVETGTKAKTVRNHMDCPIERLNPSPEQLIAAAEIQWIVEKLACAVSVRCASLEARVDNAGGRDPLLERLSAVRLEAAYTAWRNQLPHPQRMYVDMVMTTASLKAAAKLYRVPWERARAGLLAALDAWEGIKVRTWHRVDEDAVNRVYRRLECGELVDPPSSYMVPRQAVQQLAA